jgi:hypothetical protein
VRVLVGRRGKREEERKEQGTNEGRANKRGGKKGKESKTCLEDGGKSRSRRIGQFGQFEQHDDLQPFLEMPRNGPLPVSEVEVL